MRKKSPRVLLVLGWYDYRLHRGIERFAQEQGWHLSEDLAREKVIPWGWDGDGILAWLGAGDDLADFVIKAQKPTVDFSFRRPQSKFARVLEGGIGINVVDPKSTSSANAGRNKLAISRMACSLRLSAIPPPRPIRRLKSLTRSLSG